MNILMWILQVALTFLDVSGGAFKTFKFEVAKTNPLVWAALMGLVAAFVAVGRYALSPLA